MSEKQSTRINNVGFAKRSPFLFRDGAFRASWLELAGPENGTYKLVEPYLVGGQAEFIGVDKEEDRVAGNRKTFGEGSTCRWIHGDLVRLIVSRPQDFEHVGIINYDTESSVISNKFATKDLKELLAFAKDAFWRLGAFLLILNYTTRNLTRSQINEAVTEVTQNAGQASIDLKSAGLEDDKFYYRGDTLHRLNLRIHYGPIWEETP